MKTQTDLIIALSALPRAIVFQQDGTDFYFHSQILPPDSLYPDLRIAYSRYYCELTGRESCKEFNNPFYSGLDSAEIIASWKFPKGCDFHKELGKFLQNLKSGFTEDELHYG